MLVLNPGDYLVAYFQSGVANQAASGLASFVDSPVYQPGSRGFVLTSFQQYNSPGIVVPQQFSYWRHVKHLSLCLTNSGSGGGQLIVAINSVSQGLFEVQYAALATGESLHYEDGRGWYALTATGGVK